MLQIMPDPKLQSRQQKLVFFGLQIVDLQEISEVTENCRKFGFLLFRNGISVKLFTNETGKEKLPCNLPHNWYRHQFARSATMRGH